MNTEKTENGHTAVDGEALIKATQALLGELWHLARSIRNGLRDCPPGHTPAIELNNKSMCSFQEIFQAAHTVQKILNECVRAANNEPDPHGLRTMETQGRS